MEFESFIFDFRTILHDYSMVIVLDSMLFDNLIFIINDDVNKSYRIFIYHILF